METKKYFNEMRQQLAEHLSSQKGKRSQYAIPNLWLPEKKNDKILSVVKYHPTSFFLNALDFILNQKHVHIPKENGGRWTTNASVYNMFVRTTCAFDHNQNGKLDLPVNAEGWRETGTFLKAMALIPHIKSLGANTIHLLPITSIGSDGNKGTLGSPYAIKNPYKLDINLYEPNAGLGVDAEFRLFVQAAHHLGMRVVVEFVFRTASKDSDWVKDHPEWFYWIKEEVKDRKPHHHNEVEYGNPIFSDEELKKILSNAEQGKHDDSIPPHKIYRDMFTMSPKPDAVKMVEGKYIGTLEDGTRVRIPGAFADWPPHDTQPPWGDVTYLKMYDHLDFNYIAYNTLRMYDTRLARSENANKELWEKIVDIIPYYQHTFGIDGVMIDMGHALPMDLKHEMIRRAREIDPDFAFWDENFSVNDESVREGYNAVIGYQWSDQHHPEKFKNMLKRFSTKGFPLPFFATPESHNTPRAAVRDSGVIYSKYAWALSNFIPAIPFIHSGFEIGETFPVNTGLDFKKEELKKYPSQKLPLFSEYAYDWLSKDRFIDWIQKVSDIRKKYHTLIVDSSTQSFVWVETLHKELVVFIRKTKSDDHRLLIMANSNMQKPIKYELKIEIQKKILKDMLSGKSLPVVRNILSGELLSGQVAVYDLR